MKDVTIEMLRLSNIQYKQNLSAESNEQPEDIIPDVVSVAKFESDGLSINLAEVLKRLKRKIGL